MKHSKYIVCSLIILFVAVSCNRVKTTPEVVQAYADGKPRVAIEYTTNKQGEKILYKETHYFPGEKKYVEGKYDEHQHRDGTWTSWYDNGQKNSECKYIDGKENGAYHVWHRNGKPYIKGKYKMGVKVGTFTFYDSLGNVTQETNYDKK